MMTDNIKIAGIALGTIVFIFSMIYAFRLFSNATTPITLHEVTPGVTCASMVTGDGAAIDCWKIDE